MLVVMNQILNLNMLRFKEFVKLYIILVFWYCNKIPSIKKQFTIFFKGENSLLLIIFKLGITDMLRIKY